MDNQKKIEKVKSLGSGGAVKQTFRIPLLKVAVVGVELGENPVGDLTFK